MKVAVEEVGQVNQKNVHSYTLLNDNGIEIRCLDYGCHITKIFVPDRDGNKENIVLGYETLEDYVSDNSFFGCVVGRVAGRIKGGTFEIDGKTYPLAKNENNNHIHGGVKGFNRVVWDADPFDTEQEVGVRFSYLSPNGEEGYPGNINIKVTYTLNNKNELNIHYSATSDEKTVLNMTNHSYFNLSGNVKRDICDHTLTVKSDQYLPLNEELLPTGELASVNGTPFDFTSEKFIRTGMEADHPQNILAGKGYDHPFVLHTHHNEEIILKDQESGRFLTIETDEPAVVIYSGNQISSEGKILGVPSRKYLGICFETQGLPDAIHHPHFPQWIIERNQEYHSSTTYRFGTFDKNIQKRG
ncbi:aldose epimerase family protein [Bacillus sp. JJ1764]|uniref:aldose epimerase family protein n=1 Tax=Bacillus sp. JJ1764 TaxID=3122964 RepID=UPI002FFDEC0B